MTLSDAVFPTRSWLSRSLMVLGGSLFIALAAQVSVPMVPTPMTLQTLAILIVGFTYGARMGALTLLAYLAEGAAGLPVFANGLNFVAFAGPTAGFLVGFVGLAWLAGFAADRGVRGIFGLSLAGIAASALLYLPGVAWPMGLAGTLGIEAGWVGLPADKIWAGFVAPFLIGDAVKAVIAALVVSGGWAAVKNRKA
ncbi:biotin transporter BioY [Defluviimonas sp. WL0024]|uniref:Biotin transporter n=1 Tax=Albidovulum salinarum TaxID=2984153 RepID=A0ABT2X257_9RHOB|nr:biotin transporter BioY [Defluviimonas sp. WL0024]MCU9847087.1 biotin transporter BioY [Defluviimonas sp. WL0024]